eukprot:TRINITY_DN2587_c0_g1_i1.p1 TRINITY_DN2587_c0_g1~~TRINITY_DN2587_c0_g1_i1.p1  ORF type:complete len:362 (-),score=58.07 TRINITY_DN2587_c0_g1_i1:118-1161(-)
MSTSLSTPQPALSAELITGERKHKAVTAQVIFEAFGGEGEFPSLLVCEEIFDSLISSHSVLLVLLSGKVVAVALFRATEQLVGINIIAVLPSYQGAGLGRLMLQHIQENNFHLGMRLMQSTISTNSFMFYLKQSFYPADYFYLCVEKQTEPNKKNLKLEDDSEWLAHQKKQQRGLKLAEGKGEAEGDKLEQIQPTYEFRKMRESDVADCNNLHEEMCGFSRTADIRDALLGLFATCPHVIFRSGRLSGYTLGMTWSGHTLSKTAEDILVFLHHAKIINRQEELTLLINGRLYPSLLSRVLLADHTTSTKEEYQYNKRMIIERTYTMMYRGEYSTPSPSCYYIPTISF